MFLSLPNCNMENIDDEIMGAMMIDHLDLAKEFFPLPSLFPEVENLPPTVQVK